MEDLLGSPSRSLAMVCEQLVLAEASLGVQCSPPWYVGTYRANGCMLPLFSSQLGTNIAGKENGESG